MDDTNRRNDSSSLFLFIEDAIIRDKGDINKVISYLEGSNDCASESSVLLAYAANYCRSDICFYLLKEKGADANAKHHLQTSSTSGRIRREKYESMTPLEYCVLSQSNKDEKLRCIQHLIDHGANALSKNSSLLLSARQVTQFSI